MAEEILIVAGEASADLHAAGALEELARLRPGIRAFGVGGPRLRQAGMRFAGMSPDGKFVEIIEYAEHPWFLACQFHPELKSKPLDPHPLFREWFICRDVSLSE